MNAPVADARPGHNKPPITAPFDADLLEDLKNRYPKVQTRFDELVASAKAVPAKIEDEETAGKVQELRRSISEYLTRCKADRSAEKSPWSKLADIAYNFFKDKEDKLSPFEKDLKAKHTDFLDRKADAERRRQEALAEEKRLEADRLKKQAEAAAEDQMWAEARQELAEWNERDADRRKRAAQEDQMWAEARAELAAYDEAKALERRAAREAQEEAQRKVDKKRLTQLNREADALGEKDKAGTITDDEKDRYRQLIGSNGEIPTLQAKLAGDKSHLSKEDLAELEEEERNLARLRQERIDNHAAAEKAQLAKQQASRQANAATKQANTLAEKVKEAGRDAAETGRAAEKAGVKADRAERQVESASSADLSRTRSSLGTVGSLRGRWTQVVEDDAALAEYFGPLGRFLTPEIRRVAVGHYMRERMANFTETPTRTEVPGVFFENVEEGQVRG